MAATIFVAVVNFYEQLPRPWRDWIDRRTHASEPRPSYPETGWVFAGYLDKDDPRVWATAEGPRLRLEKASPAANRPYPFREGDMVRPFRDLNQVIADYRTRGTHHQMDPPWTVTEVIRKSEDYTGQILSPKEVYSVMEVSISALPDHDAAVWLRVTRVPPAASN